MELYYSFETSSYRVELVQHKKRMREEKRERERDTRNGRKQYRYTKSNHTHHPTATTKK